MSWFDLNELPPINSPDDLKKAMEVVKSRFNGHPHKYTRNDYLLFINTLYAALLNISNNASGLTSAVLSNDLTTNYSPEVGYVGPGKDYKKGDSLEKIITDILVGQRDKEELPKPSINGENFLNSVSIEIIAAEEYADKSLIYYTTSDHPGWRIYDGAFTITKDTTIKAKLVPKYDYYRFYEESGIETKDVKKIQKLRAPSITGSNPFVKSVSIEITNSNSVGTLLYKIDTNTDYEEYISPISLTEPAEIYAYVKSNNDLYQDSEVAQILFKRKLNYPKIECNITSFYDEAIITIIPDDEKGKTYYRINNGTSLEYSIPFSVNSSATIYAWQQTDEANYKTSEESHIKVTKLPTTALSLPIILAQSTVYTSSFELSLSGYNSDEYELWYQIGTSGTETLYTQPVKYDAEDSYTVYAWAKSLSEKYTNSTKNNKSISLNTILAPTMTINGATSSTIPYYNEARLENIQSSYNGNTEYSFDNTTWESWNNVSVLCTDEKIVYARINIKTEVSNRTRVSSISTTVLNRKYYTLQLPTINGNNNFTTTSNITVTNPNDSTHTTMVITVNGVSKTSPITISETSTIKVVVSVKSEYEGYYQSPYSVSKEAIFNKQETLYIYTNTIDMTSVLLTSLVWDEEEEDYVYYDVDLKTNVSPTSVNHTATQTIYKLNNLTKIDFSENYNFVCPASVESWFIYSTSPNSIVGISKILVLDTGGTTWGPSMTYGEAGYSLDEFKPTGKIKTLDNTTYYEFSANPTAPLIVKYIL